MKVDVSVAVVNDDGVPMTHLVKDTDGAAVKLYPTPQYPEMGMKRIAYTIGHVMRQALNSDAYQKGKEADEKRNIAFVCSRIRQGGVVELKQPAWEMVLKAAQAADVASLFYEQIRFAIYPDDQFKNDSLA